MSNPNFYGAGFPYREIVDLPGKLIVLEGSDGVGRSTQTQLSATGWRMKALPSRIPVCAGPG